MSPEKWEQTRGQIQDAFSDVEIVKEKLEEPEVGEVEKVFFTGPLGKMKIEYITRPVVLDRQTSGSRRIGSETKVKYIYSDTEFSHKLLASVWKEEQDDWVEIDMKESFQL